MKRLLIICLVGLMVLVACSATSDTASEGETSITPDSNPTPTQEIATETQPDAVIDSQPDAQSVETDVVEVETQTTTYNGAAWTNIALTDAVTGETFTLADFAGQTVFVHPMARWCSNCRSSQINIRDNVLSRVNRDEVVFVSLTIETNDSASAMAQYAADNGFNWVFAVATPELLAELVRQFGPSVSNPPSQPHFILSPDGTVTDLMTGRDTADEIISNLEAARAS